MYNNKGGEQKLNHSDLDSPKSSGLIMDFLKMIVRTILALPG